MMHHPRHTIDKEFHVLAHKAIQVDACARAKTSVLTHFHARYAVENMRQVEVGVAQATCIYRHDIECRRVDTLYLVATNHYFAQMLGLF